MTFRAAVLALRDGQATRTDSMRGYVKCEEIAKGNEDTWTRKFNMTFVENTNNDNDNAETYVFEVEVYSNNIKVTLAATPSLAIDSQLMELLLSEDWFIGDTEEFDEFRRSSTTRW